MKRTEAKFAAQDLIMQFGQLAFDHVAYEDPKEEALVKTYLENEFRRVEKMFGYEPGSPT